MATSTLKALPPDLLAVAGAYNQPGRGGACAGVLLRPADKDLQDWEYSVYSVYGCPASSLSERVQAIAQLLLFPTEEDQGFMRLKAKYDRIRAIEHMNKPPGFCDLYVNESTALAAMLARKMKGIFDSGDRLEVGKEKVEIDLKGFVYNQIDLKGQAKEIIEWMDGLISAIVDERVAFIGLGINPDSVVAALRELEISDTGRLKNDDPQLMALLFSVGRAEHMAQTRQLPIQVQLDQQRRATHGI